MEYLDGALDARRRRAVEVHTAGCIRCRRFLRSYVETPRIVRAATGFALPKRAALALRRRLKTRRS
jgi:anti-sigma factor RsiW